MFSAFVFQGNFLQARNIKRIQNGIIKFKLEELETAVKSLISVQQRLLKIPKMQIFISQKEKNAASRRYINTAFSDLWQFVTHQPSPKARSQNVFLLDCVTSLHLLHALHLCQRLVQLRLDSLFDHQKPISSRCRYQLCCSENNFIDR